MPVTVILDANVLIGDARRIHNATTRLASLAQRGVIRLHVPRVVRDEYIGHASEQAIIALHAAEREIRRAIGCSAPRDALQEIVMTLRGHAKDARSSIEAGFLEWLKDCRASVEDIDEGDGAEVLRRYFDGAAPFAKPRHREDVPDAFILLAVERIARDAAGDAHVHVIVADKRLQKACGALPRVVAHRCLDDFFSDPHVAAFISTEEDIAWMARARRAVEQLDRDAIEEAVDSAALNEMPNLSVQSNQLPSEGGQALISHIEQTWDLTLSMAEASRYDRFLHVPAVFMSVGAIDLWMHKGAFQAYPRQDVLRLIDANYSEEQVWASMYVHLQAHVTLAFEIDDAGSVGAITIDRVNRVELVDDENGDAGGRGAAAE